MKVLTIIFALIFLSGSVNAASINAAAYRTMQMQQYNRAKYKRQIQQPTPYWKAQSNYSTRNRMYSNYSESRVYSNKYYGGR